MQIYGQCGADWCRLVRIFDGDWYISSTPMPYFTVWTDVNINTYLNDTDKQCMTYQQ